MTDSENTLFEKAKAMLMADEGNPLRPYRCPSGHLTIGIGHNLDAHGITPEISQDLFRWDYERTLADAREVFPAFDTYSEPRQLALINLVFNMGKGGVSTFKRAIASIGRGDWKQAAAEFLYKDIPNKVPTKYYADVKTRALRVAEMLEHETYPYKASA